MPQFQAKPKDGICAYCGDPISMVRGHGWAHSVPMGELKLSHRERAAVLVDLETYGGSAVELDIFDQRKAGRPFTCLHPASPSADQETRNRFGWA